MERTNRFGCHGSIGTFNCSLPCLFGSFFPLFFFNRTHTNTNTKYYRQYKIGMREERERAVNGSALKRQLSVSLGFSLGFYDVDSLVVAIFLSRTTLFVELFCWFACVRVALCVLYPSLSLLLFFFWFVVFFFFFPFSFLCIRNARDVRDAAITYIQPLSLFSVVLLSDCIQLKQRAIVCTQTTQTRRKNSRGSRDPCSFFLFFFQVATMWCGDGPGNESFADWLRVCFFFFFCFVIVIVCLDSLYTTPFGHGARPNTSSEMNYNFRFSNSIQIEKMFSFSVSAPENNSRNSLIVIYTLYNNDNILCALACM